MEKKDNSTFMRGVEERLNSLFKDNVSDIAVTNEISKPLIMEKQKADNISLIKNGAEHGDALIEATDKPLNNIKNSEHLKLKENVNQAKNSEDNSRQIADIATSSNAILHSPLMKLKTIVLALEWEMDDNILEQLDNEIKNLQHKYHDDFIILAFLKILFFLGRYIRVLHTNADINSTSLLFSTYNNLEKVTLADMNLLQKQSILLENIDKYKEWIDRVNLKSCIIGIEEKQNKELESQLEIKDNHIPEPPDVSKKTEDIGKHLSESENLTSVEAVKESNNQEKNEEIEIRTPGSPAGVQNMLPHEAFAYALEEIKRTISVEMAAIRAEIKMWRNGQ